MFFLICRQVRRAPADTCTPAHYATLAREKLIAQSGARSEIAAYARRCEFLAGNALFVRVSVLVTIRGLANLARCTGGSKNGAILVTESSRALEGGILVYVLRFTALVRTFGCRQEGTRVLNILENSAPLIRK